MTVNSCCRVKKQSEASWVRSALYTLIFFFFLVMTAMNSEICRSAVTSSAHFCISTVVPSIFPFMVLSDFLSSAISREKKEGLLSRLFGIPSSLIGPLIVGNLCGFPIGVKAAAGLYDSGQITKCELEGSIGLMNNPSAPFVISAVGAGIYGAASEGILLYSALLLSTLITGLIFRSKRSKNQISRNNIEQKFNISESIKNAGLASVAVCSYIIFFSYLGAIISLLIKNKYLVAVVCALTEVGGGVRLIGALSLPRVAALPLTALALGFSGVSVHLQAFGLLPKDVSKKRYFAMKICEGGVAIALTLLFCLVTQP
ncbi:MAG: hypothetical protein J6Q85_04075 [Clostridia bacterium]|nr:hypothetical protein [Clostridia bacterium]